MTEDKIDSPTEIQRLYKIVDKAAEVARTMITTDRRYPNIEHREIYNETVDSMLTACIKETKNVLAGSYETLLSKKSLNTSSKDWLLEFVVTAFVLKLCTSYAYFKDNDPDWEPDE